MAEISYHAGTVEASPGVVGQPIRLPTHTRFVWNAEPMPVTAVPEAEAVPVDSFRYVMRSARIVLASDVPGKVTVTKPRHVKTEVRRLNV